MDSISLAVEHTKQQLFKPFRIGQWTRLAFVGLLAGEMGGNGFSHSNFQLPSHSGAAPHSAGSLGIDPALLAALITAGIIAALALGIILMFVGSVMRFILFDSIVAKECRVRSGWSRNLVPGWRYFVWKLLYVLLTTAGIAILVGIPLAIAFAKGWFREPKEHVAALVLGGIVLFLVLLILLVVTAVVLVLTKDFVVPQMALENVTAMEGWRRLWRMMKAEKGAYAAYIGMKIVLALAAAILIGFVAFIVGLIIAIPSIGFGILVALTGKMAGLTWNAKTISLAVVLGCVLLAVFIYVVSLISVPVIVFFPAYSVHFFAARYPRLGTVLYAVPPKVRPGAAPASL
jgi:hypothetical protein